MFRNMKVKSRLALGFSLVLVFMVAIIWVSLRQAQVSHEKLVRIVKNNNVRVQLANKMIDNARDSSIAMRDILLGTYKTESSGSIQESRDHLTKIRRTYGEIPPMIRKLIVSEDVRGFDLFNKLDVAEAAARQLQDQVIELVVAGKLLEGIDLNNRKAYPAVNQWISDLDDFIRHSEERTALRYNQAEEAAHSARTTMFILGAFAIMLSAAIIIFLTLNITRPLNQGVNAVNRIASGDLTVDLSTFEKRRDEIGSLIQSFSKMVVTLREVATQAEAISKGDYSAEIAPRSDKDILGIALQHMTRELRDNRDLVQREDWLKTGIVRLNKVMLGETELAGLGNNVISEIATYLDAKVGAFYLTDDREKEPVLSLLGSYAYTKRKNLSNSFKFGEGLVGQSAREKKQILVSNVPEDHIKVVSGLGESSPRFISVIPFLYENRVTGVIEIGFLDQPTDMQLTYLDQVMSAIAINFETVQGREKLAEALTKSQTLAEELEAQQEELRATNEELEEQTQALEESEQKLKVQQEELEVSNEELREKNESLEQQKREIEETRKAIEGKAEELAISGKYKSEFLANMSHELRTPLNSLLLLSSILAENKEGNLTEDQLESTRVIYQSGNDLLSLISEILDLSKIEAGKMKLQPEEILIQDMADSIATNFQHMSDDKGLRLAINISENATAAIHADRKRVEQIIKNLISNAIKFTEKGSVTVDFSRPAKNVDLSRSGLDRKNTIAIAIKDTGIGISPEDQKIVFEAFQQVEGGTARQYGGTGLGLSISRELARLLGGEIQLVSEKGKGSIFTIYLPVKSKTGESDSFKPLPVAHKTEPVGRFADTQQKKPVAEPIPDDRDSMAEDEKVILVIEDDPKFARLLLKLCHERGLKCLATPLGEEGLELAEKYLPEAIILDIKLPGIDGWTVLETLKENPKIRHIPVHIMSVDEPTMEAFRKGAIGYLKKPINKADLDSAFHKLVDMFSKEVKNLLVVEDDENLRKSIIKLIGNGDVFAEEAANGKETIRALKSKTFDCMILDLGLPDMTGFQLLKELEAEEDVTIPPVIVYTGRELTREEDAQLREYAESIIIKGVRSEERLLDEASLFLHRVVSKMPEDKRQMIVNLHDTDVMFKDKTVLVVDDDMRNVFALSRVLEEKGLRVLKAENGQKALNILKDTPLVDLVLMDIMMPVMDGYETMKRIREQEMFAKLPVIALTAKAMKGDKTRCIAAGASDYLPKPVDVSRLNSMMRVWLYR